MVLISEQKNIHMHNFTTEDLVLYLYNEISEKQAIAIKAALIADSKFRDEYETLKSAKNELASQKLFSPRSQSIDKIMQYAENSAAVATT